MVMNKSYLGLKMVDEGEGAIKESSHILGWRIKLVMEIRNTYLEES